MKLCPFRRAWIGSIFAAIAGFSAGALFAQTPVGEVKGSALQHTPESLAAVAQQADVVLPAAATGGAMFVGKFKDAPATVAKVPVVVFMHGSSGLALKAIGEWQQWLATQGYASMAPNSFTLPDRVTYSSPIAKDVYEKVHALRLSEIAPALAALQKAAWADNSRLVLAGASEGGVPVARYAGKEFAARMVFSWSCEDNYFVSEPRNAFEADKPVLNIISLSDPFFSPTNSWLGNPGALGHCGNALKNHKAATIVLVPGAPHTLLNLPQARASTAGFLASLPKP